MSATQKFLFDTDFDGDPLHRRPAKPEPAMQPDLQETAETIQDPDTMDPPLVTFSEDELRAARDAAYAQGINDGRAEAASAHEQQLSGGLEKLSTALIAATEHSAAIEERLLQDGLRSAIAILRKLFPRLAQRNALGEVQALVGECLTRLRQEPRIVIRVPDSLLEPIKGTLDNLSEQTGFEGRLVLIADDNLGSSDVRVEWADGGAERDCERSWQEIEKIVSRAARSAGLSGKEEAAVPSPEPQTPPSPAESIDRKVGAQQELEQSDAG